ncbi:MAG TPA: adenylate/guanylate cyclase domain-containing protein [Solirubrobacteraceae bacterium]|jgi:adenylate cyclase
MEGSIHTFLFADLVGYTALAELEGDGRALEVALALQRRVGGLLAEHRADQVKAIGDGLMLRCSDPADAVALGLRLTDELSREDDFPPVRVGIHTGPALSAGGDWYGRAVNVAARLCASAPGGEVMVSQATRTAAGSLRGVDWGERELHWLRNISQPIAAYCATPSPEPARAPRRLITALTDGSSWRAITRGCRVDLPGEAIA